MAVMLLASGPTTAFIERHPTVKMLVFSFLLLIGMTLLADGFGMHVPRGYIYAAIGFSAGGGTAQPARRTAPSSARRGLRPPCSGRIPISGHQGWDDPRLLRLLDVLPHRARWSYIWLLRPEARRLRLSLGAALVAGGGGFCRYLAFGWYRSAHCCWARTFHRCDA